jgi:hypothetical protein
MPISSRKLLCIDSDWRLVKSTQRHRREMLIVTVFGRGAGLGLQLHTNMAVTINALNRSSS